ncbi:hypothetical protein MRX96_000671 [Rhipicephalus microplus]
MRRGNGRLKRAVIKVWPRFSPHCTHLATAATVQQRETDTVGTTRSAISFAIRLRIHFPAAGGGGAEHVDTKTGEWRNNKRTIPARRRPMAARSGPSGWGGQDRRDAPARLLATVAGATAALTRRRSRLCVGKRAPFVYSHIKKPLSAHPPPTISALPVDVNPSGGVRSSGRGSG